MADKKYSAAAAITAAALLWIALALLGGPLNRFDHAAIRALASKRAAYPMLTHLAIWISQWGSARATVGLAAAGAMLALWPSDVLAGWIFGLLWAVGWWRIVKKFGAAKPA